MSLRIDTIGADAFAFARLSDTLEPRPTPRSLRQHVGAREFGDFGTFLMADKPATADLSDRVARWRTIDASARQDIPLRAHPDQSADDRRFRFAVSVTTIVFSAWIFIGVVATALTGKL